MVAAAVEECRQMNLMINIYINFVPEAEAALCFLLFFSPAGFDLCKTSGGAVRRPAWMCRLLVQFSDWPFVSALRRM